MNGLTGFGGIDLFDGHGLLDGAQEAGSVGGDEVVELIAQSGEVAPGS